MEGKGRLRRREEGKKEDYFAEVRGKLYEHKNIEEEENELTLSDTEKDQAPDMEIEDKQAR